MRLFRVNGELGLRKDPTSVFLSVSTVYNDVRLNDLGMGDVPAGNKWGFGGDGELREMGSRVFLFLD